MKKWKRIFIWTGITTGTLIAILLICAACFFWIIGSELERKLAEIKAAGEPISLADLVRKPVPPEQNGATYLRRAQDDLSAVDKAFVDLTPYKSGNYKQDDIAAIEDTLKAHPNVLQLLQQTVACPDFDPQIDYTLMPSKFVEQDLNEILIASSAARYLDKQAQILIFKGESDEAIRSSILMLQLARQVEHEPYIIAYLVSRTIEVMALECANKALLAGIVSDQIRADFDAELTLHVSKNRFRKALITERALSLDLFRLEMPQYWFHYWLLSNKWQLSVLSLFDEFLEYSNKPFSDWVANENVQHTKSKYWFNVSFNVWVENQKAVFRAELISTYRSQALVRAIRIINALQKKAPSDSNIVPTMAELNLPDELGIDPFNGKPMIIKKLANGWLVYSVAANLQDDGGKVVSDPDQTGPPPDIGFGPKMPTEETKDKEPPKENTQYQDK